MRSNQQQEDLCQCPAAANLKLASELQYPEAFAGVGGQGGVKLQVSDKNFIDSSGVTNKTDTVL